MFLRRVICFQLMKKIKLNLVSKNLILLFKSPFVVSELGDEALFGLLKIGYVFWCRLQIRQERIIKTLKNPKRKSRSGLMTNLTPVDIAAAFCCLRNNNRHDKYTACF